VVTRPLTLALAILLTALGAGCDRPTVPRGGECTLNSDCAAPFVCRLDRCRRQCVSSRDCGGNIMCVPDPMTGEGGCQLDKETRCALTSDCEGDFICQFGTCTTECAEDRDCSPGAMCAVEGAGTNLACIEPIREACVYDTDCPAPFSCGSDQLCGLECDEQRDCPSPRRCVDNLCQLIEDAGP
jgi:hypothetical protein